MPDIVTLDETKLFLRVDHDEEDTIIVTMIKAATEAVRDVAEGWDGVGLAPARLKMAVLTRVAIMFDDRASVAPGAGEDRLLLPLRAMEL